MGVQCYIFAAYSQTKMVAKFALNNIETIIFDLGGVVLNLDPQKTFDAFAAITGLTQKELIEAGEKAAFKQYEKGEISSQDFRLALKNIFNKDIQDQEIDDAWNAMLLDLPKDRLDLIGSLKQKYKTYVLSNTNEIHIAAFDKIVYKTSGGNKIQDYFLEVYYSHKVGMRKPDAEIFEMVIEKNFLHASKTLFIDDTLEHIESAKKVGLQTWHLTNQEELFSIFGNG